MNYPIAFQVRQGISLLSFDVQKLYKNIRASLKYPAENTLRFMDQHLKFLENSYNWKNLLNI